MIEITRQEQLLTKRDLMIGTVIAIIMATVFTYVGGIPLVATFLPSLVVAWLSFVLLYTRKQALPKGTVFVPLYLIAISWQFIHFNEEFTTGFAQMFPTLYGTTPFSHDKFVSINMISYFLFTISCLLVFTRQLRFLMVPVLFFIMAGALGNAVWHSWWVIWLKGYFPGFVTAQLYWVIGFVLLNTLVRNWKTSIGLIVLLMAILLPSLTFLASPGGVESVQHLMATL